MHRKVFSRRLRKCDQINSLSNFREITLLKRYFLLTNDYEGVLTKEKH